MEAGYLSVEIEQLELGLKSKPDKDPSLRLDLAITNAYNIFQWASTGDEKFSTSVFHPMYRSNEEVESSESPSFSYINGFSNQFVRSTFIDLNDEVMNGLANAFLEINVVSINDKPADAAPAKPAKGAPPVEAKPAEESLIKLTLPLHALLTAKNCILNLYEVLSIVSQKVPFNTPNAIALHESIVDNKTSLSLKISSDNDFAEYVLGSKVFQWSSAQFISPPATWGLHAPDVTDPKAKVPPTAVELRSKYLENINRLIKEQSTVCSYELSIGLSKDSNNTSNNTENEVEESSGETSVTARIQSYFPYYTLTNGKIIFNNTIAETIPTDEDIRIRNDLWTVSWNSSPVIFMNRKVARKFLFLLFQDPKSAYLPIIAKKIPTSQYTEIEGDNLQLTGRVNIQTLTSTGLLQSDLTVLFDNNDINTTTPTDTTSTTTISKLITTLTINSPLLPISAIDKLPSTTENNNPNTTTSTKIPPSILSNKSVTNTTTNTDILSDLRVEITKTIEKIATEYVSLYPESTQSLPTLTTTNINITTTDNTMENNTNNTNTTSNNNNYIQTKEERKNDFLNYLINNGIFHELKESLKPKIQQLIREKYGNRGRALGKSNILKEFDQNSSNNNENNNDFNKEINDNNINILFSELYIYLIKECNIILNSIFSDTIINRNIEEFEKYSYINDEKETNIQCLDRLLLQANDLTANGLYNEANSIYLERIQIINHNIELNTNTTIIFNAYKVYGEFLLQQSASILISCSISNSNISNILIEKTQTLLNRAREALYTAYTINPSAWQTGLLYAGILIELDQIEQAEVILQQILAVQLTTTIGGEGGNSKTFDLQSFNDFDGYDSDALCPVDPQCYSVLAALFHIQGHTLKARKALLMANRSFAEGAFKPDISTHGTPRRTIVLTLSEAGLYLFKHCLIRLAQSCTQLAINSETAVTAKATARGKPASTVPHIKYLLKRLQSISSLYGISTKETVVDVTQKIEFAVQCGKDAQLVADNPLDEVQAWGTLAIALQLSGSDNAAVVDAFLNAVGCSRKLSVEEVREEQVVPLGLFVQTAKLLLQGGRYNQARTILLYGCTIYTSATLFMLLGVCYLRLDELDDAEVALVEANLLDNRNSSVWAYLCLVCLASGPHRMVEAEKSLEQTLRLGQEDSQILRELATSFMSVDKLQTAEDLIRRALRKEALEAGGGSSTSTAGASNRYTSNARTRRLLADILAGQNQAVKAVDEYQLVIADETADVKTKLEACERCSVLLSSLGREEELLTLKNIINALTAAEQDSSSGNNTTTALE